MSRAVATIKDVDEYGPIIEWRQHWGELKGRTLYVDDLAQEKAEPVAFQCCEHGYDDWHEIPKESYGINRGRYKYRKLYTAPLAERVRVPDECSLYSPKWSGRLNPDDARDRGYREGWNACRAAMLSAAPEADHHE